MPSFVVDNVAVVDFILINMALALSIYVTLNAGLLSLANAGFMAIGAYTAAIVATQSHVPLAGGFALAVAAGAIVALPFGLLVLRLHDLYLAIATLGFGEIVRILALNGDTLLAPFVGPNPKTVFNGGEGITLPYASPRMVAGLPEMTWIVLAFVVGTTYILATIHRSHHGRVLAAIRLDEPAAATLGVDVVRYKLAAFVLGAAIASGTGALTTPIIRVIDPSNYTFAEAVDILAYAVLGGMTHWVGPIVGATVLTALPETLRFLKDQREIVNGLIIMLSIIYLPRGLADPRFWSRVRHRGKKPLGVRTVGAEAAKPSSRALPADRAVPDPARAAILDVDAVSCYYGGLAAVDQVSFRVAPGTICGVIGPNGAGKTTLINAMSGLTPIASGRIWFDGLAIDRLPPHRVAASGISRSFQNIRLFSDLSVLENVAIGCHRRARPGILETLLHLPGSRAAETTSRSDARKLLSVLRIEHLAETPASALSYGDQRRVEVARALASDPKVLLLDEPAAGMNQVETEQLADLLLDLRRQGLTLLVIEHDMGLIMRVSDVVVVLNFGRKIAEGPPDAIRRDPHVIKAYLGEDT